SYRPCIQDGSGGLAYESGVSIASTRKRSDVTPATARDRDTMRSRGLLVSRNVKVGSECAKDQRWKKGAANRRHPVNWTPGRSTRDRHQHAPSSVLDRSTLPGAPMTQSPVSARPSPLSYQPARTTFSSSPI